MNKKQRTKNKEQKQRAEDNWEKGNSFEALIKETRSVNRMFRRQYDKRDRALDLVEEVGELVQAMQIVARRKTTQDPVKQRTVDDVADALSDILYNVILLADDYDIDLVGEYREMLRRLRRRLEQKEFV